MKLFSISADDSFRHLRKALFPMSLNQQNEDPIWDLAIIGGGIAGAGIARDAALRGIRTILFEKNTFASGASSKSSKLIHGGLRYLETAWTELKHLHLRAFWKNFQFVVSALRETHILYKTAPDLISPIHLLIPIYQSKKQSRPAVYAGTLLYGLLARLTGGAHGSKILWNAKTVLRLLPSLDPEKLTGGVLIWDHTTDDASLVRAVLRSATIKGAEAYENTEVLRYNFLKEGACFEIFVRQNGETRRVRARKLVNASGAWIDGVRELAGEYDGDLIVPVAGSHIGLPKFTDYSVILQAEDGRIFFVINRSDLAWIGTTERLHKDPDHVEPTDEEIEYLLASLRRYFPSQNFTREAIRIANSGIRPLANPRGRTSLHHISREHEIVEGPTGALHILGVKLTDHRRAAEEVVDLMVKDLRTWNPEILKKSRTRSAPLDRN